MNKLTALAATAMILASSSTACSESERVRESLPVLHRAFFANYKDTNAANELYDRIKKFVGGSAE